MKKKTIVFTGGGTAGHVIPNIAIIDAIDQSKWHIAYIGSKAGIEKKLITDHQINYFAIATGKLRRYISFKNVTDLFKVGLGVCQAYRRLSKLKPALVFSKGGFVSLPVVIAAAIKRIPIIIHESDLTPGLANRLVFRFASHILTSFKDAKLGQYQPKVIYTGNPIRQEFFQPHKVNLREQFDWQKNKPILLIVGGSGGSKRINELVLEIFSQLIDAFYVIHITGAKQTDAIEYPTHPDYKQYTYVTDQMFQLLAQTEFVLSRAGANAIFETIALHKPSLLLPLSTQSSRGEQWQNANYFAEKKLCLMLADQDLTTTTLLSALSTLKARQSELIANLKHIQPQTTVTSILQIIQRYG